MFCRPRKIKIKIWEEEQILDKITAKDYKEAGKKIKDFLDKKVG